MDTPKNHLKGLLCFCPTKTGSTFGEKFGILTKNFFIFFRFFKVSSFFCVYLTVLILNICNKLRIQLLNCEVTIISCSLINQTNNLHQQAFPITKIYKRFSISFQSSLRLGSQMSRMRQVTRQMRFFEYLESWFNNL